VHTDPGDDDPDRLLPERRMGSAVSNYAAFGVHFPASEVSTIDYFHPNVAGENDLAAVSWKASFWGS
jgi:hypothetical protein